MSMQRVLWFVIVATIGWGGLMQFQASRFDHGNGNRPTDCDFFSGTPILDLELSTSGTCFRQVVNQGELTGNIAIARTSTHLDFVFIALYWTTFVLFAVVYKNRWSVAVVVCVSAAAILDIGENFKILYGLSHLNVLPLDWASPRVFSFPKW